MNLNNRITLFVKLGRFFSDYINNNLESLEKNKFDKAINESILHNSFFSKKNILKSLLSWSNVLTKKSIDFVLATTNINDNEWVSVKTNVKNDFKKLHNLNVDELNGVAIMSDTDNSKMKSIAYYQNIFFSSE